ncbi:MAG: hypothetical protein WKG00_17930 [Polyangiaceae bacterium]
MRLPIVDDRRPTAGPAAGAEAHVQGEGGASDFEREDATPFKRRAFLQVMGTALAMGAGCTKQPEERIIPFVRAPEDVVAGRPLYYASAAVIGGVATGVVVEQNEGRPSKVDGSPEHPMSLGGSDVFIQGATFDLYDPDRSKTVLARGQIAGWRELGAQRSRVALEHRSRQGEGLRILTGAVTSPTLVAQLRELQNQMPGARWHWYEAVPRTAARAGAALAFEAPAPTTPGDTPPTGREPPDGLDAVPHHDLARADVVVSLDADLFGSSEGHLRHARDFASRRGPEAPSPSRLYVFEPTPSITGARADHRPVRARTSRGGAGAGHAHRGPARRRGPAVPASPSLTGAHLDAVARTCAAPAPGRWWWPATSSRRRCMRWRRPSTPPWARWAPPSSIARRSSPERPTRWSRCASCAPTSAPARCRRCCCSG